MFEGQHGGVTEVKFSPDGTKLYSGGRKVILGTENFSDECTFTHKKRILIRKEIGIRIEDL
jgi:hypothetical protein